MKIKITKHQARLIEMALDVLSRMTMGQLKEIIWGIERTRGKIFEDYDKRFLAEQFIMKKVKPLLFPDLSENASHGVGGKGNAQIMYEMVKCLQIERSKNMSDEEAGVLKHEPLHYSDEPLIEVEDELTEKQLIKKIKREVTPFIERSCHKDNFKFTEEVADKFIKFIVKALIEL